MGFMAVFSRQQRDAALEDGDGVSNEEGAGRPQRRNQVGDVLREARRSYGVEIAQIAASLRIKAAYLSALEEARYQELPGPTYAVGFLRAYAEHLGLDGEEMVRRFKREVAGLDAKHDLSFPVPLAERSIPRISMLVAALILAGCGYGLWYYISSADRARPERVSAVPSTLLPERSSPTVAPSPPSAPAVAAPSEMPVSPTMAERPAAVAPQAIGVLPSPPPAASPSQATDNPQPAPAPQPAPGPTAISAAPVAPAPVAQLPVTSVPEVPPAPAISSAKVYGNASGPARIVIKASGDSWVQVRDQNQAVVLVRVLHAGDIYRVPDQPGLVLRTGNAGALQVAVDGKEAPGVGPLGKSRNVALDPNRLLEGKAVIE